jgi:hypothetical protein
MVCWSIPAICGQVKSFIAAKFIVKSTKFQAKNAAIQANQVFKLQLPEIYFSVN